MTGKVAQTPERELTEKEQRLVGAIIHAASRGMELTREQAGTAAGYGRGETARVAACRALARPAVRTALLDGLRDNAGIDAAGNYAVVRHLARKSSSDRVRLDAAMAGLRVAGVDSGPQMATGPGIVLNLMLDPKNMAILQGRIQRATSAAIEHTPDEEPTE